MGMSVFAARRDAFECTVVFLTKMDQKCLCLTGVPKVKASLPKGGIWPSMPFNAVALIARVVKVRVDAVELWEQLVRTKVIDAKMGRATPPVLGHLAVSTPLAKVPAEVGLVALIALIRWGIFSSYNQHTQLFRR
jgi:hypothetical protein